MISEPISVYLNSILFKSIFLDNLVYFCAQILPLVLLALIVYYFIFVDKKPIRFLSIALITLTSLALSEILKAVFSHPRPFLAVSEITQLFTFGSLDSFPSGHATVFSALATAMYFENRKIGTIFIIGALLIGLARVVSGVHYLEDVLAGFVIGFGIVFLSYKYIGKLRNKS